MSGKLSRRGGAVDPFIVMDVMAAAAEKEAGGDTVLHLEAVDLPTSAADRFQPTVEALAKAGRIDGLIVASPSNPTGTMVGHGEMKALAAWCNRNGVRLISDEIYHGIVYEGDTASAVE